MGAAASAFSDNTASTADKLHHIPCFSRLPQAKLAELAKRFESRAYAAGDVLVEQGHCGDTFFLVVGGEVEVEARSPLNQAAVYKGKESAGYYFGETSLLGDTPRTATVRALTAVAVLALKRRQFLALVQDVPDVKAELMAVCESRLRSHLVGIPLFAQFSEKCQSFPKEYQVLSPLDLLGSLFNLEQLGPKQLVYKEGAPANKFYIVIEGVVRVTSKIGGRDVLLDMLKKNSCFGEVGTLDGRTPRICTTRAFEPTLLMSITSEKLSKFIELMPSVGARLRELVQARTARTLRHVPLFEQMDSVSLSRMSRLFEFRHFGDGEHIYEEGKTFDGVALLVQGEVNVTLEGLEEPVCVIRPVTLLGEVSALTQEKRSATCTAVGSCVALHLPGDKFYRFFNLHNSVAAKVVAQARDTQERHAKQDLLRNKSVESLDPMAPAAVEALVETVPGEKIPEYDYAKLVGRIQELEDLVLNLREENVALKKAAGQDDGGGHGGDDGVPAAEEAKAPDDTGAKYWADAAAE